MKRTSIPKLRTLAFMIAMFGTLACSFLVPENNILPSSDDANSTQETTSDSSLPIVQLATPLENAVYLEGVGINVMARITNAGDDIDRVEILVDNQIVATNPLPNPAGAPEFTIAQTWVASGAGTHTIGLNVFRQNGSSSTTTSRNIEVVETLDAVQIVSGDGQPVTAATDNQAINGETGRAGLLGLLGGALPSDSNTQPTEEEEATPPPTIEEAVIQEEATEPEPTQAEEPTTPPTAAPVQPSVTVIQGANIRSGPGTGFGLVGGGLTAGTVSKALAVTSDRTWYKIEYYNGDGWVSAQLVNAENVDNLPIDNGPPPPTAAPVVQEAPPPAEAPASTSNRNITFNGDTGIDPFPAKCGDDIGFKIQVINNGSESLGSQSSVVVRDVHIGSNTFTEARTTIPNLEAGATAELGLTLRVDTNFDSAHRFEIYLDSDNQVAESNEGDNRSVSSDYTLEKGSC